MAEFPALPLWTDANQLSLRLEKDGWRTPNSYKPGRYGPITNRSAVYLLTAHRPGDLALAFIAYVGMATKLRNRLDGHEVRALIRVEGLDSIVWFKAARSEDLRAVERSYIRAFSPPWNVLGKDRGIAVR